MGSVVTQVLCYSDLSLYISVGGQFIHGSSTLNLQKQVC